MFIERVSSSGSTHPVSEHGGLPHPQGHGAAAARARGGAEAPAAAHHDHLHSSTARDHGVERSSLGAHPQAEGTTPHEETRDERPFNLKLEGGKLVERLTAAFDKLRSRKDDEAREAAVTSSLRTGQPVTLHSELGSDHTLQVTPLGKEGGKALYSTTVDGLTFEVSLPENSARPANTIGKIADYVAETPPGLRPALKSLSVEDGANPQDDYFARKYGMPGFQSAATAGGGHITFWNGTQNLQRDVLNHEMGHVVAEGLNDRSGNWTTGPNGEYVTAPKGWPEAATSDHREVSSYGQVHLSEDFAEAWKSYQEARRLGPASTEDFRNRYPNRAALLDQVLASSL